MKTKLELVNTNLRRYTFESKKIKNWVEENSFGRVLNLFAGYTLLDLDETRVDLDSETPMDYCMDVLEFVRQNQKEKFNTIILDPPYSYRKSMEMYKGNYSSRFKQLADEVPRILTLGGSVISFGYHTTFLGKVRGFYLEKLCVFAHGGAQHATLGIVEKRIDACQGFK